jgi:hypothetical protein
VFAPVQYVSATTPPTVTTGFPVDMLIDTIKGPANESRALTDRLRGTTINFYNALITNDTSAESATTSTNLGYDLASNTSTRNGLFGTAYGAGYNCITWNFRRAPSFFDEVCYTGTGANTTFTHNLGVAPELMIVKVRSAINVWAVYCNALGPTQAIYLNSDIAAFALSTFWNDTAPTSSVFTVGTRSSTNTSGDTYVVYLFATCAGVSKVGSYTGNGSTQTIDCGFGAGGARFVLIKRTDDTGDWYVYDTARGMTVLTDPYFWLNSTNAEVATLGSVTTVATGFALNSTILAAINVNAGTYIFLAIA